MALAAILISALVAGIAAILVTMSIEKWGGLHGGVLATVPSTIVPAAVGIWLAIGNQSEFRDAMGIVPIGLILNAGFLYLWRIVPPLIPQWRFSIRLTAITLATLTTWGLAAAASMVGFRFLTSQGIDSFSIGVVALFFGLVIGFASTTKHRPSPRGENKVGTFTLLMRGVAASASIGVAVWLSSLGNPLASGVMSIFPAIFTTSMVALWLSQGEAVPAGAIGPMMFGSQSVSLYALLVALLYPRFDTLVGMCICSVLAWIVSVLSINFTVWFYLKSKANSE
ncbi:MAG TPA: hypothetical protein QF802_00240 [Candidatus Thalassarchaeaceae archaeon]|nr:hypothetical protein [Candidatus Thalassarchaeaceae archaeon]